MTIEDIALTMTPGIGVKGAVHLLEAFGGARQIFAASAEELIEQAALRPDIARQIAKRTGFAEAERELAYCRRHDIRAIASTDPEYPVLVREIPDYPHILYIKGNTDALAMRCISFVGTRNATPYGQLMCSRLIEGLAERVPGLCIVSGLAFGIDVAAHRAALASGIPTIGVLASTLPEVTPSQHTPIAREMLEKGGALVSELHSQSKQNGNFYLARNRIIAALSAGTVVVESPDSGGSLFTAHCADGYNRTVMTLPGRATDRTSMGSNHLIQTRKAQMVLSAQNIVEELRWELNLAATEIRPRPATQQLTPDEAGLLECFRTDDPLTLEILGEVSGLNPGELATLVVGLELAGAVRQLPGNQYMRLIY